LKHKGWLVQRLAYTEEVAGSTPASPTIGNPNFLNGCFRVTDVGKVYLVRVFVDVDRQPAEVVTVYRTSKVSKYWRGAK
jgi:hypothetical protein